MTKSVILLRDWTTAAGFKFKKGMRYRASSRHSVNLDGLELIHPLSKERVFFCASEFTDVSDKADGYGFPVEKGGAR